MRRDDIEALGHILMWLGTGGLPWIRAEHVGMGHEAVSADCLSRKRALPLDELCAGMPCESAVC